MESIRKHCYCKKSNRKWNVELCLRNPNQAGGTTTITTWYGPLRWHGSDLDRAKYAKSLLHIHLLPVPCLYLFGVQLVCSGALCLLNAPEVRRSRQYDWIKIALQTLPVPEGSLQGWLSPISCYSTDIGISCSHTVKSNTSACRDPFHHAESYSDLA